MDETLERELIAAYPSLYDHDRAPSYGSTTFPFECDDGWYPLLDGVSAAVQRHAESAKIDVRFEQVKQKFAERRIYIGGGCEHVRWIIKFARALSTRTCERCSRMRTAEVREGNWSQTLCDDCWGDER